MTMRSIGLVIWIASSAAFVSASVEVATDGYGRRLIEVESMRKARHEHSPLDKTADKAYSQKKFSALTQSLCRAEADGFFGATFGEPLVFQYGFEMETSKYAQLNVIFDAVSEHVMDSVLSSAFPETCRTEGRNLSPFAGRNGRVTGFYFDQQVLPISSGKQEGECLWFVQPSPTPSLKCPSRSCFVSFDDRGMRADHLFR
jgi:hypothetical protein